jgi:outer membrane immunogenic protein
LTFSSSGTTNINAGVDWMGTVRGRIGFLFNPNMLVYATGGLTYGGVNANINNVAIERAFGGNTDQLRAYAGGGMKAQTLVGWNVGGGFEWMFIPNWSLKAEALYWDMGSMNVATTAFSPALDPTVPYGLYDGVNLTVLGGTRVNYQGVIARAGVNYHFNWGAAPVVAKN